jgi:hypothetical protein
MKTYSFTLILDVRKIDQSVEDALFETGCDDGLLGSRGGVVYLDVQREAASLQEAIRSAVQNVQTAGFQVVRIEPDDLINAAEIARRTNRSRESIRQLAAGERGPGGFPLPIASVTGTSPLWRWSDVVQWFVANQIAQQETCQEAETIRKINAVLEVHRIIPDLNEVADLWHSLALRPAAKQ